MMTEQVLANFHHQCTSFLAKCEVANDILKILIRSDGISITTDIIPIATLSFIEGYIRLMNKVG